MVTKITKASYQVSSINGEMLVVVVNEKDLSSINKKGDLKKPILSTINAASSGALTTYLKRRAYKASPGASCVFNAAAPYGLVVVYGAPSDAGNQFEYLEYMRNLGDFIVNTAKVYGCKKVSLVATELNLKSSEVGYALGEGLVLGGYSFEQYKGKKKTEVSLGELQLLTSESIDTKSITQGQVIAQSTCAARDIVNMPPSDCTPSYLAGVAKKVAKQRKLAISVFGYKDLKKMGAGGLLGVSAGSDEEPFLIRMVLKPKKKTKRVIGLVGKGVTFDSGGLSIKPSSGMEDMKCDMAGAAAVLFAMDAIAQLDPHVEVRVYIPTCENMINGRAMKLGDVLHTMSGQTIEVTNTDAEGRLILSDALCLAQRDECDTIIDLATLTGACMVALGTDWAGLFSDDDKLAQQISKAAESAGERIWRLPMISEYRRSLDSKVADIKNSGERWGGAITAALFLKEFVDTKKVSWAHLDIAGPAFYMRSQGYMKDGGTGFGVRTLVEFIKSC